MPLGRLPAALLLLSAWAIASGCEAIGPRAKPSLDQAGRIELDGFSILPPGGTGWDRLVPPPQGNPYLVTRLYYIKILNDGGVSPMERHHLSAVVRTRDVGPWKIEDRRELLRVIARSWQGASVATCPPWECVRYESTIAAVDTRFMISMKGFVIVHLNWPAMTVNVEYRQYYGPGVQPLSAEAMEEEVAPFPVSLEFIAPRRA